MGLYRGYNVTTSKGVTVNINRDLHEKIKKRKYEVKTFVNAVIEKEMRRLELLEKIKPYLRVIEVEGNSIYIKDDKRPGVIEVRFQNGKLQCTDDGNADNCVHVAYCFGLGIIGASLSH